MYRIVFHGNVHPDHNREQVKERLGKLFRIEDQDRLETLFSGAAVTIKKSLDEATARKYLSALDKAGALVEIDPPLPSDDSADLDLADFQATSAHQDLSFNTVMQSFSDSATVETDPVEPPPVPPESTPQTRIWKPLAVGAGAALLVAAAFIFWPGDTPNALPADRQASLEQLFAIAAEGSEEEFRTAISNVRDDSTRKAMFELREAMASIQEMAEEDMPEFDMARLQDIAFTSSDEDFAAAVRDERDVDARRLLLELREQRNEDNTHAD
jgi:hypothetical protein